MELQRLQLSSARMSLSKIDSSLASVFHRAEQLASDVESSVQQSSKLLEEIESQTNNPELQQIEKKLDKAADRASILPKEFMDNEKFGSTSEREYLRYLSTAEQEAHIPSSQTRFNVPDVPILEMRSYLRSSPLDVSSSRVASARSIDHRAARPPSARQRSQESSIPVPRFRTSPREVANARPTSRMLSPRMSDEPISLEALEEDMKALDTKLGNEMARIARIRRNRILQK